MLVMNWTVSSPNSHAEVLTPPHSQNVAVHGDGLVVAAVESEPKGLSEKQPRSCTVQLGWAGGNGGTKALSAQ